MNKGTKERSVALKTGHAWVCSGDEADAAASVLWELKIARLGSCIRAEGGMGHVVPGFWPETGIFRTSGIPGGFRSISGFRSHSAGRPEPE
jgi:hypothetical protein